MSSMPGTLLRDPTAEATGVLRPRTPPLRDLRGRTVALLDIGKMRGSEFIDRVEQLLAERGVATRRYAKATNTRTAPVALLQAIATECHAVVVALSD